MLLLILGIIDALGGIILALASVGILGPGDYLFYLAIFFTLKGIWSLLTSIAAGFYADLLGAADLVGGISMFLVNGGFTFGLFLWFGIALILKGLYSIAIDISVN